MKQSFVAHAPSIARCGISIGALCVAWELVGSSGRVFAVPPLHDVLLSLWDALRSGELWAPTAGTMTVAGLGFLIAAVCGVSIGVAIGLSETTRAVLEPVINALYSTPMAMFIPIIGIYLGLRFAGQVFLVVTFCIFLIVINTAAGVRQVPAEHWELGRSFRFGPGRLLWKIILPNASPYILAGLRISVARAVAGAIAAELLMSSSDLGLYLSRAGSSFDIERLVAGTLFVALLGAGVAVAARILERRLLGWTST